MFGGLVGKVFGYSMEDCITIALETGIQNAGVAIVLLRISLPQPEADISLGEGIVIIFCFTEYFVM